MDPTSSPTDSPTATPPGYPRTMTEVPAPLRRDVRLLSTLLGRVLEEAEGPDLLRDVERLRRAAISLRREPSDARRREAERIVEELPRLRAAQVARAFTAYFQLVNLAEEHQRVRTLRERGRAAEDSIAAAVDTIRERDGAQTLDHLLDRLELTPVITAHPTEARRRSVVENLWRIGALLEELDAARGRPDETDDVERRLAEEVSALWRTDPLRRQTPEPLDEVRAAMALFDQTIFRELPHVIRELDRALGGDGTAPPRARPYIRWGSWVGADRDGNPNVTADVTRAAAAVAIRARAAGPRGRHPQDRARRQRLAARLPARPNGSAPSSTATPRSSRAPPRSSRASCPTRRTGARSASPRTDSPPPAPATPAATSAPPTSSRTSAPCRTPSSPPAPRAWPSASSSTSGGRPRPSASTSPRSRSASTRRCTPPRSGRSGTSGRPPTPTRSSRPSAPSPTSNAASAPRPAAGTS